ncbi:uncharacterized protein [Chironomus tepperi]|uniref:uncharacterized protein n=1 Tax=Chironomus tepperi TaxID=113505 RepID=UPI00391F823B
MSDNLDNEKKLVGKMQFRNDLPIDVYGIDGIYRRGLDKDTDYKIVVREINHKTLQKTSIDNDIETTKKFKTITYVLKINKIVNERDKTYLGYEEYKHTLRKLIELNDKKSINENKLKYLFNDLFKAVKFFHDKGFAINNISADNIAVCDEDESDKLKIFNLSRAEKSSNFTQDINDIGLLLISLMNDNDSDKSPSEILDEMKIQSSLKLKMDYIINIVKQQPWIQPYNINLFAHLIYCLVEAKNCDYTVISLFPRHPYFWKKADISEFITFLNLLNPTGKKNGKTKFLGKTTDKLNAILKKYDNWQEDLHEEIQKILGTGYLERVSELMRFMRNKDTHYWEESKELRDFCDKFGGFICYFLQKHPNLLYDLFMYHWRESSVPNLSSYYPSCFISENVNDIFDEDAHISTHGPSGPKKVKANTSPTNNIPSGQNSARTSAQLDVNLPSTSYNAISPSANSSTVSSHSMHRRNVQSTHPDSNQYQRNKKILKNQVKK